MNLFNQSLLLVTDTSQYAYLLLEIWISILISHDIKYARHHIFGRHLDLSLEFLFQDSISDGLKDLLLLAFEGANTGLDVDPHLAFFAGDTSEQDTTTFDGLSHSPLKLLRDVGFIQKLCPQVVSLQDQAGMPDAMKDEGLKSFSLRQVQSLLLDEADETSLHVLDAQVITVHTDGLWLVV